MKAENIYLTNKNDQKLAARLDFPVDRHPVAYAVFAHCFSCSKNSYTARNISRGLILQGIAVLSLDFTGLGDSEEVINDFSCNTTDILAAATYLAENYQPPAVLIGHSLGGVAALMTASQIESVKAVVTIGTPADTEHVQHLIKSKTGKVEQPGQVEVSIGGSNFQVNKDLIDNLQESTFKKKVSELRCSLLIMHSPEDRVVSIDNAAKLYGFAPHPKSFISLNGTDHLLSAEKDSLFAAEMIATWAKRYLEIPEEEPLRTDKQVAVRNRTEAGYTSEVKAGNHGFLVDEPLKTGGNDLGPTPYDLLNASLGACTAITLRMYATRKNWPLDEVIVHLLHEKVHAEDCEDCGKATSKIDRMTREIELKGDLDEAQKARLLEIANHCPVHRTLLGDITILTSLREA